ncbi:MAG TPA: DUF4386 family protein [Caldilineae bacterium]|nr:DUF4386 family protein [Caldilineae bacterium]
MAGLIAATWLPLFVLLFFGLMTVQGLDQARFGDPDHVLGFFMAHPALIRLTGLVNITGLLAASLFALLLADRLMTVAPGMATLGGFLAISGWTLILVAETLDLGAYVGLPAMHTRDPAAAALAFITLQAAGRMTRTWGYLLVALGIGALGRGMRRMPGWPRGLGILGLSGAGVGILMFGFEYVLVTQTGDPGGGLAGPFAVLFILLGAAVTVWHAWGGIQFLKAKD